MSFFSCKPSVVAETAAVDGRNGQGPLVLGATHKFLFTKPWVGASMNERDIGLANWPLPSQSSSLVFTATW